MASETKMEISPSSLLKSHVTGDSGNRFVFVLFLNNTLPHLYIQLSGHSLCSVCFFFLLGDLMKMCTMAFVKCGYL